MLFYADAIAEAILATGLLALTLIRLVLPVYCERLELYEEGLK